MNKKISEIARELDVKPGIILKKVRELGIDAESVASDLTEADQNKLLEGMGMKKNIRTKNVEKKTEDGKVVSRKKVIVKAGAGKKAKQAHSSNKPPAAKKTSKSAAGATTVKKRKNVKVTVIRKHKAEEPEEKAAETMAAEPESKVTKAEPKKKATKAPGKTENVEDKKQEKSVDTKEKAVKAAKPAKTSESEEKPKKVSKAKTDKAMDKKDSEKKTEEKKEAKPLGLTGRKIDLTPKRPTTKKPSPRTGTGRSQGDTRKPRQSSGSKDSVDDSKPIIKSTKSNNRRSSGSSKSSGRYVQQDFKPAVKKSRGRSSKYRNKTFVGGGIKRVNEVLSEDYVLNEYYSDDNIRRRRSKRKGDSLPKREVLTYVKLPESMTVKSFAETIKKQSSDVIAKLMGLGIMAGINDDIDFDAASLVADEYGITAELQATVSMEDILFDDDVEDPEDSLVERAPVVVVMGHVDHGKTSLLDTIKNTDVVATEAGAITQHVGAYNVHVKDRVITFLDTPGHEAFTSMRKRGAQVTDIAIIVVAADDGIMPQTVEAINHAKDAGVSIIVAINKMDLPAANQDKVKQELTEYGIVPEEWGGDVICVPVSAKTGDNIDSLLDMVLLTADVLELKANPDRQAKGTVIEAKLDEHKGVVTTLLVQKGTLRTGDCVISGTSVGRVRAMTDDKGNEMDTAGPSMPAVILGLDEVPNAGETFYSVEDEKTARNLAEERKYEQQQQKTSRKPTTLDELFGQIQQGDVKELKLIVKADVKGSVEAVTESLEKLSNEEVTVKVIHGAAGTINESDINLAEVSNAIIIGFNVRPGGFIIKAAEDAGVDIRLYRIIYNAVEEVEAAMKGMLDPKYKEVVTGHAEIRQIFKVSGIGTIGGCMVTDGRIKRNSDIRVVREGIVAYEGKLASLKRFTDDVKEVQSGYECGMSVEKYNDIKEGDVIEAFEMVEIEV